MEVPADPTPQQVVRATVLEDTVVLEDTEAVVVVQVVLEDSEAVVVVRVVQEDSEEAVAVVLVVVLGDTEEEVGATPPPPIAVVTVSPTPAMSLVVAAPAMSLVEVALFREAERVHPPLHHPPVMTRLLTHTTLMSPSLKCAWSTALLTAVKKVY